MERGLNTIIHLIETTGPGGAETVFLELVRGLDPARWRCIAVTPSPRTDVPNGDWLATQLRASRIETVVLDERGAFDLRSFWRLTQIVRTCGASLVHAHFFGSSIRAALLSIVTGIPSIGTLHGVHDIAPNERYLRAKIAIANRGLSRLVFVSEPLRQAVLAAYPLERTFTRVIPNGVDPERCSGADGSGVRSELGIDPAEFVVGTVGNLTPAKGTDVFIRAAAILKAQGHRMRFVVAGDLKGEHGERLAGLRDSLGLENEVILAGFRSDIPRLLASFDMYALTSRSEGFSIALVEAMAAALPVVATRCGGPEQILRDGVTGMLVENESPGAVAAAIAALWRDPARRAELAHAASNDVRQRFSVSAQIAAYEREYTDVMKPGHPGSDNT